MAIPEKIDAGRIIGRINLEALAEQVSKISIEIRDEKKRTGGVLAVAVFCENDSSVNNYAAATVGQPGGGLHLNLFYVNEKINRTRDRRLRGIKEFASSQSANDEKKFYGGCIVAFVEKLEGYGDVEIYFSYSGAKAEVDEAVSTVLAAMSGFVFNPHFDLNSITTITGIMLSNVMQF
ncbi:MAG: hypothetical protein WCI52_01220 [bacterium]